MFDSGWVMDNRMLILGLLVQHLQLMGASLLLGTVLACLMVAFALWFPAFSRPLKYLSSVLFTVPSLALFILLMPLTGLSKTTSVIGLSVYSLLIIVQNLLAGLESNPADVLEEARALGYTRLQGFFAIELPLALPSFIAGLRTTAITLVGLVTVTALIGQGGLGQLFITGLTLDFTTPVIVSLVLTMALALTLDGLFYLVESWLFPWRRR
jgi:osmoprotectant transport system permease protein